MAATLATLLAHVWQSNLIENIRAKPGSPHHVSHLRAAGIASEGRILHPNILHQALVRGVPGLERYAGSYRHVGVFIGKNMPGNRMPSWLAVPALMDEWLSLVHEYENLAEGHAEAAQLLHDWFLCIHPYADGNGRTARLVLNMLRVSKGLPWHIEPAYRKRSYYARIRAFEEQVFREHYKDARIY